MKKDIHIPNRFESILDNKYDISPLILPVEHDLRSFEELSRKTELQRGGALSFLLGKTGIGKTTSVYSASVHMSDKFERVFPVPYGIELRSAASWLRKNLPQKTNKQLLVLFDGREVTDDGVGVSQFLSSLNQLLRRRQDIIFCWPTTDQEWHYNLRTEAERIGGVNFVPKSSDIKIKGPLKEDWVLALQRLLEQIDIRLQDIAITERELDKYVEQTETIGSFLAKVRNTIAETVRDVRLQTEIPKLIFVISSGPKVTGEANRIRRAGSYKVKAQELLQYSPRSKSGRWWQDKIDDPTKRLAYILTLFDVRLATLRPTAVAHSYTQCGPSQIKEKLDLRPHLGNAKRALQATDLYKFLIGETKNELTSTRKGRISEQTMAAYKEIQSRSSRHHKEINQTICNFLSTQISSFEVIDLEANVKNGNLFTDAIVQCNNNKYHLEFHHLSPKNCRAATMSSYIMGKVKDYATNYNLV